MKRGVVFKGFFFAVAAVAVVYHKALHLSDSRTAIERACKPGDTPEGILPKDSHRRRISSVPPKVVRLQV